MPWCDDCNKFWNPTSVKTDGSCPTCGRVLDAPDSPSAVNREPITAKNLDLRNLAGADAKAPWHFKLMIAALVIYLGWRLVQLIALIFR